MNDEELKEMLKLYTKKDLWEFNQIKAKKQIELMAQIKEQDQKIKELQQQLAEKNELFIATKWRADDLEKQLTEKEKDLEIKELQVKNLTESCSYAMFCSIVKQKIELEEQLKLAKMGESFEQEKKNNALKFQNQTAIAELGKVKEMILEISIKNYVTDEPFVKLYRKDFDGIFDQQIKSLKGEK